MVESQPLVLLQHTALIKQLLEYVLHLPPPLAAPLLRSLLPLQRQRPELRDHLVMLLRKAMFYKEEELRLTAVHGFLLLLQDTAADAPAGGAAVSSSGSGGGGAQLQLELLNSIRRSFGQQPSIRKALYAGLVPALPGSPPSASSFWSCCWASSASTTTTLPPARRRRPRRAPPPESSQGDTRPRRAPAPAPPRPRALRPSC